MTPLIETYNGVYCKKCGRTFDTVSQFEDHIDDCPSGHESVAEAIDSAMKEIDPVIKESDQ